MNINRSLFIMSFEITDIDFTVKYKLVVWDASGFQGESYDQVVYLI